VDPRLLGIEFTLPPTDAVSSHRTEGRFDEENLPLPGWHGIDVNDLQGTDRPAADGKGGWVCFPGSRFRHLQQFEPVAMAGYSIYICHVTREEANRVRRESRLPELAEGRRSSEEGRDGGARD